MSLNCWTLYWSLLLKPSDKTNRTIFASQKWHLSLQVKSTVLEHHAMKTYKTSSSKDPHIINLGTRLEMSIQLHGRAVLRRRKSPWVSIGTGCVMGPRVGLDMLVLKGKPVPAANWNRYSVTLLTELLGCAGNLKWSIFQTGITDIN